MKSTTLVKPAIALLAGLGFTLQAQAGIPVIDGANVALNQVTMAESIAQTIKQIEEYKMQSDQFLTQVQQFTTQKEQYANMLQNTAAPVTNIWGQAQDTIKKLTAATDTLEYYKQQAGSLEQYLSKFQDLDYYRNSPCFTASGCSDAERANLEKSQEQASRSQKKANDAMFQGLEQQQANIRRDSDRLQDLQRDAQDAKGQMQAIGYANQLASQQANQLLQIRALLMAQQNALATKMQAEADKDAQHQAASEQFWDMGGATNRSKSKGYTP
ncbi:P-type conjugative transfer protein TrbJ [Pseudomonas sp. p21]|uniref:P-type conjugative transfer protein TrbJ n=1 Tax=Pseudomonas sp. p21 TaxID=1825979 RepID=UPI0007C7F5E2|nr:P-type conjugative transfer protein TrbJ [Pseudomonas sp. p21]